MSATPHPIVTHSGAFHADEIAAIALLRRFMFNSPVVVAPAIDTEHAAALIVGGVIPPMARRFGSDGVEDARTPHVIIRTRNASLLEAATKSNHTIVVDVGGIDNADMLNFDHHQASMNKSWENGPPLSAAGLVWKWLRANGKVDLEPGVCDALEHNFVIPLDAHDNGVRAFDLADVIGGYNRSSEDPVEQDTQFSKALEAMSNALDNAIHRATVRLEAEKTLGEAWEQAQARGEDFVILRRPLAYPDATGLLAQVSKGQASLVGIPGQGNRYSVISLRQPGSRFASKHPVPGAWRGRTNFKAQINGKPVSIAFAHKTGFMCVVEGGARAAATVASHVASKPGGPSARKTAGP